MNKFKNSRTTLQLVSLAAAVILLLSLTLLGRMAVASSSGQVSEEERRKNCDDTKKERADLTKEYLEITRQLKTLKSGPERSKLERRKTGILDRNKELVSRLSYYGCAALPPKKPADPIAEARAFGKWSGTYKNSKGHSDTSSISFTKGVDGKIKGNEDGTDIENVTVDGNLITFKYKLSGCRTVAGSLTINADGKTASGSYTVTECNSDKYTGDYIGYKKQ